SLLLIACSGPPSTSSPAATGGPSGSGTLTASPGTTSAAAADPQWPVFGHDHANSRNNSTDPVINPTSVAGLKEAWRIDGLTGQTSTPAVVGGVVYFGDWTGKMHAVKADDGQPVWDRQFTTDQINDSPLVTADTVYVADGNANFHALDRTTG